jgi:acetyl esterase/lipase
VDHEGKQIAEWLNSLGVTAYMLKYRIAPRYKHPAPLQDAQRAIRTVRARAAEWKVDPQRIGIMGFSAGGEVVSLAAFGPAEGSAEATDPIDRLSGRPNFLVYVYPGPVGIPDVMPRDAPPAFLCVAADDRVGDTRGNADPRPVDGPEDYCVRREEAIGRQTIVGYGSSGRTQVPGVHALVRREDQLARPRDVHPPGRNLANQQDV